MNQESNNSPLVSVLMTAYNREAYIAEAIESVLASTYRNFELIIVDDGSSDNTVKMARSYEAKDDRVMVYVNEKNLGDYPNRNKAAKYSRGKYIKYVDSDDCIYPWTLCSMVWCMEQNDKIAIGFSTCVKTTKKFPIVLTPEEVYQFYFYQNKILNIGPTGVIIRKEIFEKCQGFKGIKYTGDTELWLRICQNNKIAILPDDLIFWRVHSSQEINFERENTEVEFQRFRMHLDYLNQDKCPLSTLQVTEISRNLKNIKARKIIRQTLKDFNLKKALLRSKKFGLKASDYINSCKKNKKSNIDIKLLEN